MLLWQHHDFDWLGSKRLPLNYANGPWDCSFGCDSPGLSVPKRLLSLPLFGRCRGESVPSKFDQQPLFEGNNLLHGRKKL